MDAGPTEPRPAATMAIARPAVGGIVLAIAPYLAGWLWMESKSYYSPLAELFGNATVIATTVVLALVFHAVLTVILVRRKRKVFAVSIWLTYQMIILLALAIAYLSGPPGMA